MSFFPSLFYGWIVTACAFVVLFVTYGVQYSFGVFLPAMLDELGWHRASLGGAFSLYTMVYSGCSWISGRLRPVVQCEYSEAGCLSRLPRLRPSDHNNREVG